jgi:hypothetical protein
VRYVIARNDALAKHVHRPNSPKWPANGFISLRAVKDFEDCRGSLLDWPMVLLALRAASMAQDRLPFPTDAEQEALLDDIINRIRDMTVGFLQLSQHVGHEDASPAGTGTLVEVDGVRGVLTASHVLDALPDRGRVGLVRFTDRPDDLQQTTIDMALSQKIAIGNRPFGPLGPDLGFLLLPEDLSSALAATNLFFNASMRADDMRSNAASGPYFDALVGVLAEMTRIAAPLRPNTLRKGIEARIWLGNIERTYEHNELDLLDFDILFDESVRPPDSYEGVSGGALWRVKLGAELRSVVDIRVVGIAFYQNPPIDGHRLITCHGPRSIYDALLGKIGCEGPRSTPRTPV